MKGLSLKTKKQIDVILGIALVVFLILFVLYDTLRLKTATSLCFVASALLFYEPGSKKDKRFPFALTLGLIASLVGDVSIYFSFVAGAIAFAIGHLCYTYAHFSLCPFRKREIAFTAFLFLIACIMLLCTPFVSVDPALYPVCFIYSLIISFMASKSVSNFIEMHNRLTHLVYIGSLIFCLSDMMVFFNTFNTGSGLVYKNIGHLLYFPAQYVIAQSVKYYYNEESTAKLYLFRNRK